MKVLDVGCGRNKHPGAVGMDWDPASEADVIYDLNTFPYPFPDDEFDQVICSHIVEHLDRVVPFMEEIHRLAKNGALVRIVTPHFTNRFSYADPTHRHHFGAASFDGFLIPTERHASLLGRILELEYPSARFRTKARFEKVSLRLSFGRPYRFLGVQWLANRFLNLYELYLAFLFPARDIYLVLRVVK